jgi:hypothetical protein
MKKTLPLLAIFIISFLMISWGYVGHKTVATIAENHLTPEAKAGIKELLGDQTISDVASWADEVRDKSEYKSTFQLHFINAPLGLTYQQFSDLIEAQGEHNVYSGIRKYQEVITSSVTTKDQKAEALKFIVHFVGDAHQPFHVSRKEDKGGNTIQVQFDGKGTNLHSLWDSGLINKQGLPFDQMAKEYDNAIPTEIKKWQSDPMMQWMWESYQLSTKLYAEIDKNNVLGDEYYKQHITIVQQRIEMAGIRLAGVLNELFSHAIINCAGNNGTLSKLIDNKAIKGIIPVVDVKDASKCIGMTVNVTAQVYGIKDIGSMVLVNLGATYPDSPLTLVLKGDAIGLANTLKDKMISVTGTIVEYKGKPEIIITNVSQVNILPIVGVNNHH